jgi:alpha-aminoadipate/glutamate carrier protein LysW
LKFQGANNSWGSEENINRLGLRDCFNWRYTVSYCPECEAVIDEEFEDVGELITCPECGVELEVISIDPVEFDLAPIDDEDEDDEFRFNDAEDEEEWDDDEDSYDEDEDSEEEEM